MSTHGGVESNAQATEQKPRRQPCCGFCRNHELEVPVINHQCKHADCDCVLCELTRRRRTVMRHQQRLWRFKKNGPGRMENVEGHSEGEVAPGEALTNGAANPQLAAGNEQQASPDPAEYRPRRKMVCDKCRNHKEIRKKRGHKGSCPYESCKCQKCIFTNTRQSLMKYQQRVRRSQLAHPAKHPERRVSLPLAGADSPTSDLQSEEEPGAAGSLGAQHSPTGGGLDDGGQAARGTPTKPQQQPLPLPQPQPQPQPLPQSLPQPQPQPQPQTTEEWAAGGKEVPAHDAPWPPNSHAHPGPSLPQPPSLLPMPEYQVAVNIHASNFNKSDQSLRSVHKFDCPESTVLPMRHRCLAKPPCLPPAGPLPQALASRAPAPMLPKFGPEAIHQRPLPWMGGVPGARERCSVGSVCSAAPQIPVRPQPISAARLPQSQMDWRLIGFPYASPSVLQAAPQPPAPFCENFRLHGSPGSLDEQWRGMRVPHPMEGGGCPPPYSVSLPYFASALLHPSAKHPLSLMPPPRTLPGHWPPLGGFRQRDQHREEPPGSFSRNGLNPSIRLLSHEDRAYADFASLAEPAH